MTNICGDLLASTLCGSSVASRKELEYLRGHNKSPGSQGP